MEFYYFTFFMSFIHLLFQFPTRWNSTKPKRSKKQSKSVSVPNGMEFYTLVLVRVAPLMGFNSQWDGILRIFVVFHFYSLSVSIPNGMEFYIGNLTRGDVL